MDEIARLKLPEAFHFNVSTIDEEHQSLVDALNACMDRFDGVSIPDFEALLDDFMGKMRNHFVNEEALMEKTEYPGFAWHRDHHAKTLKQVEEMKGRCMRRGYCDNFDIQRCFEGIIVDVARADMKFFDFLTETGQLDAIRGG